jgi:hypothetical protein
MRPFLGVIKDIVHGKMGGDFVRLLGRISEVDSATRLFVLECALRSRSVDVRDAGVQAAETWNDRKLTRSLRRHQESVGWLAEYVRNVVEALEA